MRARRLAYRGLERKLMGRVTLRGYLHDLDLLLYCLIMPKDLAFKIHERFSRHHENAVTDRDYLEQVIERESLHLIRPHEPKAREFYKALGGEMDVIVTPFLNQLGL